MVDLKPVENAQSVFPPVYVYDQYLKLCEWYIIYIYNICINI